MTDAEIFDWVAMLGRGRKRQIEVIKDLLAHASLDEMSPEDQATCNRALELLALPKAA